MSIGSLAGCALALLLVAPAQAIDGHQAATAPPPAAGTTAASAEEVVAKNLQARGGLDKLKGVRAMRMKGLMQAPNGTDVPTTIYMQRPNQVRQEITLAGRVAVQAFDGTRGWALNPSMGNAPVEVPVGVARRMAEQADFDGPLVDAAAKGHKVELAGPEQVGDTSALKLRLVKKSGEEQFLFIDTTTWLEIKSQGEIEQGGRKMTVESRYGDFRTVDGVTVPFTVEVVVNGQPQQKVTLSSVEFPASLDAELFQMPGR